MARKESQLSRDRDCCNDLLAQLRAEFGIENIDSAQGQAQVGGCAYKSDACMSTI